MSTSGLGRILCIGLLIFVALASAGFGVAYGISEWKLYRKHDAPLVPLRATAPPNLVEGERMARIVGCWDGCHGRRGQGGHEEVRGIIRHTAPTLSQVVPNYTDEELARLIRYGLKRDGTSAIGMISYTFWALGDQDLAGLQIRIRP